MVTLFDRKAKTAPSHYPRILFHSVRFFQLISSVVVGAIMSYFIWHLTHDHWSTPWTFIWLASASLFSIAALLTTMVLHCCIGLNPRLNIAINGFLLILWALSWSLLTWYMSGTLAHECDAAHWHEEIGMMVCRIYKALFTFTLLGLVSTATALGLDLYVRRLQSQRGIYQLHDLAANRKRPEATRGPFTDDEGSYAHSGLDEPRQSEAWDAPRPSMGPYAEQRDVADKAMHQQGYSVPENQFDYDTGYHGGHEERAFS
ncbi:hypothetical protein BAUCODRAFT_63557 [Baudoinia panamericana UAMH 10762]|uniref:MARVEL domain-containing protein n=1 Tax=Baudoinia panamericana (strain UAMH 10762) TaxID=717646 RepID=M2LXZ5_BAUPA|nr:uncharacterized protein BAUCODRAFT_63557 [Baudoinia panamericana UAMH 10762]EMC99562.1 hypothetical protein BAUCODRAFT_63557 [Baudoinia panamericana UAMH 10762]